MESHEHGAMVDRVASQSSNEAEVARMKLLRDARVRALLARRGASAVQQNDASKSASADLITAANGGDSPIRSSIERSSGPFPSASAVSTRRHPG